VLRTLTFVSVLVAVLLIPGTALAQDDQEPQMFLERALVQPAGDSIDVFRLPIKGRDGLVRFFDLNITLTPNPGRSARPLRFAPVVSEFSPRFPPPVAIVPGDYVASNGAECTLVGTSLPGGRDLIEMRCLRGQLRRTVTLFTGPVEGHPDETILTDNGFDMNPALTRGLTFGRVTEGDGINDRVFSECDFIGNIVGILQVGNEIFARLFTLDDANLPIIRCSATLFPTEP